MDIRPLDRRGLTEVVTWSSVLVTLAVLMLAKIIKTGDLDHELLGPLLGVISALMARGAQAASERSAREDMARQLEDAAKGYATRAEQAARRAEDAAEDTHPHKLGDK